MSTGLWDESDSDDDLPAEWEQTVNHQENLIHYHNRLTGFTQQYHPITGQIKQLSDCLPPGWCTTVDENDNKIFTNTVTNVTTVLDPRVITAFMTQTKQRKPNRQFKYDRYTSADDILLNKDLRGQFIIVTGASCGLGLFIALKLFAHGATVICASPKCPNSAQSIIPGFNYENIKPSLDEGNLFWIPYNAMDLQSVTYFAEIYKELKWPLHSCILVADLFHCQQNSILFLSKLCNIVNLKSGFLFNVAAVVSSFSKSVRTYLNKSVCWFLRTFCPNWIPPNSCECSINQTVLNMSQDGVECMMQYNYLAPSLLLKLLFAKFANYQDVNIVIVSNEVHRAVNDITSNTINWTSVFYQVPSGFAAQLKRYAMTKCFLLLYCYHLLQTRWSSGDETCQSRNLNMDAVSLNICASTGSDPFGFQCVNSAWLQLRQAMNHPLLFLIQLFYMLTRPFGQSLPQAAASPIFCAINGKNIRSALLSYKNSCRYSGKKLAYLNYCRPAPFLLDGISTNQLATISKLLATKTEDILTSLNCRI